MRTVILVAVAALSSSPVGHTTPAVPTSSVIQLEFGQDGTPRFGTAVLVDREAHADGVTLYYLTSDQLFGAAHNLSTIGVLRVAADDASDVVPRSMLFEAPAVGEVFTILGLDRGGHLVAVDQSVSSLSPGAATGNRSLSTLVGCIGAPAMLSGAVFGIVSACHGDDPPTIELLAGARAFLASRLPALQRLSTSSRN